MSPAWQDVCIGPGEGTLGSLEPAALKAPSIKLPFSFCVTSAAGLDDPALSSWCAKRAWSGICFCIFLALAEGISEMRGGGEKENGNDRTKSQIACLIWLWSSGNQTFLMCFSGFRKS
ncbi:unnamed protein product [Rangifer tarandus platyrhynchus]|uniref:Uncharacterized protein n=2 Tax=Rangifer tarandus platyrhynchus TaxID=3082113 RepID=A0AC60A4M9_RANTA|nr:unnamed protein product [Rangifer tarandus platyrhynchus]